MRRDLQRPALHLPRQRLPLGLIPKLEHLLANVIPKHIRHDLVRMWHDLVKHLLAVRRRTGLELDLDEAGAVLVRGELDEMIKDVLSCQR
jgi:hypothetical protein